MKILTLTSSYPKFPGDTTAPFIESITKSLADRGHEITVVLPARRDLAPQALKGVVFRPYRYALGAGFAQFGYAESLRADVKLKKMAGLVAPLAVVSGAARVWAEVIRTAFDVVHAHWAVPNGTMALPAVFWSGRPLVVSLHGSDVFLSEKRVLFRQAARLAFRRADAVTACSEDLAERSRALGSPPRLETIPYGVDTDLFRPNPDAAARMRKKLSLTPEQPLILAVGRLVHKKGFDVLIDAVPRLLARHSNLRVVIGGRGDLERALSEQVARRGVESAVSLVGNIPREELPDYYAAASIVAVPSVRDPAGNVDGLPNVLLEAMASGAAVVASAVGGIPQALEDRLSGRLVGEKNPEALADAVSEILASREERRSLGDAARRRARDAFSWSRVGERFEALFLSVTEARGRAT